MNKEDFEEVKGLEGEQRYDFFLGMVVDAREIYILVNENNEFLKLYSNETGAEFLPVWPSSEFAEDYNQGTESLKPKSVTLPTFLSKWLKGLVQDGLDVGVFPGPGDEIWVMTPSELKEDLQAELSSGF